MLYINRCLVSPCGVCPISLAGASRGTQACPYMCASAHTQGIASDIRSPLFMKSNPSLYGSLGHRCLSKPKANNAGLNRVLLVDETSSRAAARVRSILNYCREGRNPRSFNALRSPTGLPETDSFRERHDSIVHVRTLSIARLFYGRRAAFLSVLRSTGNFWEKTVRLPRPFVSLIRFG